MSWKDAVADNFGVAALEYDAVADVQRRSAEKLASLLPEHAQSVLEIGCGTGVLTQHLVDKYPAAELLATDISGDMLDAARMRVQAGEVAWEIMDGEHPSCGKKYDVIVANMAFQWFEDLPAALGRLGGCLRDGGAIFYTMPNPQSFAQWRSVLDDLDLPVGMLGFETCGMEVAQDCIDIDYPDALAFLRSVRRMGAHKSRAGYVPLNPAQLLAACQGLDTKYGARVSWNISYLRYPA